MEKYLRKCLDSLIVKEELMPKLEVLVINDGSKDSSSSIAHEYANRYQQTFKVIDKENGNYGSCVNRGLAEATGKYIKILDADDYFNNQVFGDFLEDLRNMDADMIVTDFAKVNEQGKITEYCDFHYLEPRVYSFSEFNRKLHWITMHAVTYKRAIFKDLNYRQTEGISYTDTEWMFLPMIKVNTVFYKNILLYSYLLGRAGQTADPVVIKKSMSHSLLCLKNKIMQYKSLPKSLDVDHRDYLKRDLLGGLNNLYKDIIFTEPSYFKDLSEIEQIIDNTDLKDDVEKFHVDNMFPYYYVKEWRKHGRVNTFARMIYMLKLHIYNSTRPASKFVRRWLHKFKD